MGYYMKDKNGGKGKSKLWVATPYNPFRINICEQPHGSGHCKEPKG